MKSDKLERQIHTDIVQLLRLTAAPGVVFFHVANERRTTPREGAFLKRMGVLAGVADFTILIPQMHTHGFGAPCTKGCRPAIGFLEVKRPGGRLSASQEQFRDDVTAIGCLWGLVYSMADAEKMLRSWGAIRTSDPVAVERAA